MLSKKDIFYNLSAYGFGHFLIDAVCAGVAAALSLKTAADPSGNYAASLFYFIILYNLLAFAAQPVVGFISDTVKRPRLITFLGYFLVGLGALIFNYSLALSIFFLGIGNALFHIGGGSISLNLIPRKALAPAIFVAPGAFGLFIGALVGKSGALSASLNVGLVILILSLSFFSTLAVKKPEMDYSDRPARKIDHFEAMMIFILLAICVRSFIGMAVVFPWKTDITLLAVLTIAIVLGKALGGVLGDKFGWSKVAVSSLLVSAPLLAFGAGIPSLGMIGMFLFNMTMPITMVAVANIFPGKPGFAFGLNCLALIIGALPFFYKFVQPAVVQPYILCVIIFSALSVFVGLKLYKKNNI